MIVKFFFSEFCQVFLWTEDNDCEFQGLNYLITVYNMAD